jgi:hypothetical protein
MIDHEKVFTFAGAVDSDEALSAALVEARADVILVLPERFAERLDRAEPAPLQVLLDGTDNNSAPIVEGVAQQVIRRYNADKAVSGLSVRGLRADRGQKLIQPVSAEHLYGIPAEVWGRISLFQLCDADNHRVRRRSAVDDPGAHLGHIRGDHRPTLHGNHRSAACGSLHSTEEALILHTTKGGKMEHLKELTNVIFDEIKIGAADELTITLKQNQIDVAAMVSPRS